MLFVHDLERSQEFYCAFLGYQVVVRDVDASLLRGPQGDQLFLREQPGAVRTIGAVGMQYVIWAAHDEAELRRCEEQLKSRRAHRGTTMFDEVTMVEGRDPDDVPVVMVYPGPDVAPMRALPSRIYMFV